MTGPIDPDRPASDRRVRLAVGAALLGLGVLAVLAAPEPATMLEASRDLTAWIERNPGLGGGLFLVFATLGKVTPVPGGVGPMTIACLLRNTAQAACAVNGADFTVE